MADKKPNDYVKVKCIMFNSPGEEIFHKNTPIDQVMSYLKMMCSTVIITDMQYTSKEPRNILREEDNL